ncbi:hypothetical protein [Xiamenia xianingshaonis]|uniref:DUF4064 domain-containing protein n=1 Tax=Xiamenia xianingshaonis TaxID=2682776 RepID=A0ABX0IKB2_9ACTN|nr:hypothetical protein [Xiamenia xianingshaonis]
MQRPALIASAASLVVGGIAVLFHLAQPLHIFNGFGNPTSGITQELIVIVVLAVVMVVYFAMVQRNDGKVPSWCAVLAIVVSVVLDVICAHSYMMASLPAWDSVLQVLSVVGGSCAVGPMVVAVIADIKGAQLKEVGLFAVAGSLVGLATTLLYLVNMSMTGASFTNIGTYLDPTNPTAAILDPTTISPFGGDALLSTCTAVVASAIVLVVAVVGKKQGSWKAWGAIGAIAALVAMISLRVVFYMMGVPVFGFYGITG